MKRKTYDVWDILLTLLYLLKWIYLNTIYQNNCFDYNLN